MDIFGIDLVAHLSPLKFAHLHLALEPLLEIQRRQMDIQSPFGESFAERRNHFPLTAALAGDEPGEPSHVFR